MGPPHTPRSQGAQSAFRVKASRHPLPHAGPTPDHSESRLFKEERTGIFFLRLNQGPHLIHQENQRTATNLRTLWGPHDWSGQRCGAGAVVRGGPRLACAGQPPGQSRAQTASASTAVRLTPQEGGGSELKRLAAASGSTHTPPEKMGSQHPPPTAAMRSEEQLGDPELAIRSDADPRRAPRTRASGGD